jgi:hypothetical protein
LQQVIAARIVADVIQAELIAQEDGRAGYVDDWADWRQLSVTDHRIYLQVTQTVLRDLHVLPPAPSRHNNSRERGGSAAARTRP